MLNKFVQYLFVLTSLLTSDCAPIQPPTKTALPPAPLFTDSPRPTSTLMLTPNPHPTRIAAGRATAAAALTQVFNIWATKTQRVIDATRNAPTPDEAAKQKQLVADVMAASTPKTIETHLSPDGQLRAEVVRYDCVQVGEVDENAYEQLKIVRVNDGTEMVIADQLQYCGGLGAARLGGLFWSPNGRYFYFTSSKEGVPDGCCCEYWVRDMSRADLNNDTVEDTPGMGELLADGTTVVIPGTGEFILWDLDEGEIERAPYLVPNMLLIAYQLSPDKSSLVYLQAEDCIGSPGKTFLIYWDFATDQHTMLLEAEEPPLVSIVWETPGQPDLWFADSSQWQYDLVTGELTPQQ